MADANNSIKSPKIVILFGSCLLLSIVLGMIFPRLLAYLPPAFGLIFGGYAFFTKKITFTFPKHLSLFVIAALTLCILGCCHSPDTHFSLERTMKVAIITLPSLLLIGMAQSLAWPRFQIWPAILTGIHIIFGLFMFSERLTDHQITSFIFDEKIQPFALNRHFIVFSLYSLCLLFFYRIEKNKVLSAVTLLVSLVTLSVSESQTSQLGFLVGVLFFFLFPAKYPWLIRTVLAATVIFCLAFPFMVKPMKSFLPEEVLLTEGVMKQASIVHRLEVWEHSVEKTFEKPIFGHGIEAMRFLKSSKWMHYQKDDSILHSHNAALQIWLEFGLIGILLGCGFLIFLFIKIEKIEHLPKRQFYFAMLMSCLCISFTGYGLWQSWQLGMFMLFAAVAFSLGKRSTELTA